MNYYEVDPSNGNWSDIEELSKDVDLMFDFVANHASVANPLVQNALIECHLSKDDPRYEDYKYYKDFVITFSDEDKPSKKDLESLARPRPNPVLTRYQVIEDGTRLKAILGEKLPDKYSGAEVIGSGWVWTTFSRPKKRDGTQGTRQVDLNFSNPLLLLETIKILLFYINKGARLIRLDAIGYIWKKLGSTSLHETEAHKILEITNEILEFVAPEVITIAEVNEPQDKVLTYLGDKDNPEADLVYQFTHFPLAVHAVLTEKTKYYKKWINTLDDFNGKQFITITGSHDGMGLKPVRGILPENEIDKLTNILIEQHKALPNHASLPGGKQIVYEICATPWNLVNNPNKLEESQIQIERYLVTIAMGLMLRGLPAFYINGLTAAGNYLPQSDLDENRTINREQFDYEILLQDLSIRENHQYHVMEKILRLLDIRAKRKAFAPHSIKREVIEIGNEKTIGIKAAAVENSDEIIGVFNVSDEVQEIELPVQESIVDVISGKQITPKCNLKPYGYYWLSAR
jgi:sucrose phosphorylase